MVTVYKLGGDRSEEITDVKVRVGKKLWKNWWNTILYEIEDTRAKYSSLRMRVGN